MLIIGAEHTIMYSVGLKWYDGYGASYLCPAAAQIRISRCDSTFSQSNDALQDNARHWMLYNLYKFLIELFMKQFYYDKLC